MNGKPQGKLGATNTDSKIVVLYNRWEDPNGMAAGNWEVRFMYKGNVVARATVKVQAGAVVFPISFGDDYGYYSSGTFYPRTAFSAKTPNVASRCRHVPYTNRRT